MLDPDVLDCWLKGRPEAKSPIGKLRTQLNYRHWVAHGRYWAPKLGFAPGSPEELAETLSQVMRALDVAWG